MDDSENQSAEKTSSIDLSYWIPYVFNRTALGAGTIFAFLLLYHGYYLRGLAMLMLIPIYFRLKDYLDAP